MSSNKNNLKAGERDALSQLKANLNIVVRQADKGGVVVILDREIYYRAKLAMLSDINTYRKLHQTPLQPSSKN